MKHREERVVGGEVKPTAVFGEDEEETDPQVLYDRVSSTSLRPFIKDINLLNHLPFPSQTMPY